jgi:hypothetical protein
VIGVEKVSPKKIRRDASAFALHRGNAKSAGGLIIAQWLA